MLDVFIGNDVQLKSGLFCYESQIVQIEKKKNKVRLTFNKFAIKVKRDFSQAQKNQVKFHRLSFRTYILKS